MLFHPFGAARWCSVQRSGNKSRYCVLCLTHLNLQPRLLLFCVMPCLMFDAIIFCKRTCSSKNKQPVSCLPCHTKPFPSHHWDYTFVLAHSYFRQYNIWCLSWWKENEGRLLYALYHYWAVHSSRVSPHHGHFRFRLKFQLFELTSAVFLQTHDTYSYWIISG